MTATTASVRVFAVLLALTSTANSDDEFLAIFDGSLDGWSVENTRHQNFTARDGHLRVEAPEGWLRYGRQYDDFVLRIEFRFLTDDADSGVFVRAVADSTFGRGWPGRSYQVQLRNPIGQSPFPPVGGIFRHGMPPGETSFDPQDAARLSLGTSQWQWLEIELSGERLRVRLNDQPLTEATGISNPRGYIGLQGETGAVEFRTIEILER